MKMKLLAAIAGGLLAGLVSSTASAAVSVRTCGTLTETTPAGGVYDFFTCPSFDPSLGTLTGVNYSFSASYSGTFEVINLRDEAGNYSGGTASMPASIGGYGLNGQVDISDNNLVVVSPGTLGPVESVSVPFNSTVTATGAIASQLFDRFYFDFPDPMEFEFAGEIELPPYESCNGVFCIAYDNPLLTVSVTGSLTYTFDPIQEPGTIPEPGTLALLGLGLAGLAATRRRKT